MECTYGKREQLQQMSESGNRAGALVIRVTNDQSAADDESSVKRVVVEESVKI